MTCLAVRISLSSTSMVEYCLTHLQRADWETLKSYAYSERSCPYFEDASSYHQYEVVGDFNKIKEYVNNCPDVKLKTQIEATVKKYYKGDYSRLISYK